MKNKNIKVVAGLACAISMGAGLAMAGGAYADAPASIYVSDDNITTGSSTVCYFYGTSSFTTVPDCDATYGSYDETSKTLTLGVGVDDLHIHIDDSSATASYTIKASSDISAGLNTPSDAEITFDLGEYTWMVDEETAFSMPSKGDVIWKSGNLSIARLFSVYNDLTIEGGEIVAEGENGRLSVGGDLFMKDGEVTTEKAVSVDGDFVMDGGVMKTTDYYSFKGNVEINDGEIEADTSFVTGISLSSLTSAQKFDLNGGVVTLNMGTGSGIMMTGGNGVIVTLNINDGELNINNAQSGIASLADGNSVNFNGGVTTIKNSTTHAIIMHNAKDYERAITFGEGMGIVEPELYIFYFDGSTDGTYSTGITAANTTLTIAEGGEVRRIAGWEMGDDDEAENYTILVPDTGVFSGENGGTIAVVVSIASLVAIAGTIYGTVYVKKRLSNNVGFRKR